MVARYSTLIWSAHLVCAVSRASSSARALGDGPCNCPSRLARLATVVPRVPHSCSPGGSRTRLRDRTCATPAAVGGASDLLIVTRSSGGRQRRPPVRPAAPALTRRWSASALWINFNCHEAVTVTMDHPPLAILSTIDGRRSKPHFLRLTGNLPSEPLQLDRETEPIAEASGKRVCTPGFVVERFGRRGQEPLTSSKPTW